MRLPFGYVLKKDKFNDSTRIASFAPPENMDGSSQVIENAAGYMTFAVDFDGTSLINETALITKYRNLSRQLEVERAIDDIVNEAIVYSGESMPVFLDLSASDISDKLKEKISDEFDNILKMMNFRKDSYEIFKRFYVDGRLYYHKIIDEKKVKQGIIELRYIDPARLKNSQNLKMVKM